MKAKLERALHGFFYLQCIMSWINNNNNNNNNNSHDNVYGAVIMTKVIARIKCALLMMKKGKYGDSIHHCWGELQRLLPNPNVLVAISKYMWVVKFCTNKILQFLTGDAS